MTDAYEFDAEFWLHPGTAGWVFLTLPIDVADDILDAVPATGGFGSVKVEVRLGRAEWSTSLFPDKTSGSFVLPVKRAVRQAAGVDVGDSVRVHPAPVVGSHQPSVDPPTNSLRSLTPPRVV